MNKIFRYYLSRYETPSQWSVDFAINMRKPYVRLAKYYRNISDKNVDLYYKDL